MKIFFIEIDLDYLFIAKFTPFKSYKGFINYKLEKSKN